MRADLYYNCIHHLQQKGVGMKGPLVDAEGYPRADIDIFSVRHARHRIACKILSLTTVLAELFGL